MPLNPFLLRFFLLLPGRYHSSPSSPSALRRDSRTTTEITTMWVLPREGEKDGVIRVEGEEKDKGKGRNCNLLCNVHQIDVAITRKTRKAQNALLTDLLTSMQRVDHGCHGPFYSRPTCTHTHSQIFTSNCDSVWLFCLHCVFEERRATRLNMSK